MKVFTSQISFTDCIFEETQADEDYIDGYGRFLYVDLKSNVEATNTLFSNGEALQGGAIYLNNCKYNILYLFPNYSIYYYTYNIALIFQQLPP
jgi:hypothetical protein